MKMIPRTRLLRRMMDSIRRNPITALLGPRQCGKTTLAQKIAQQKGAHYFDLENPADLAALDNPHLALRDLRGMIVIDEVQRLPHIFSVLRVLADRKTSSAKFLLLGSASPELIRGSAESLAGRIEFISMDGFSLEEIGDKNLRRLWTRGGFPRSFLARSEKDSSSWRKNFIQTFLERDIPQLGITISAQQLRRFWIMTAHYHGQTCNMNDVARSLSVSPPTIRHWLDLLTGAFMIRQLPPWFENAGKRIVKSSKIYLRDSGLLHTLLSIENFSDLQNHPKLGASWEGFAMEQILHIIGADSNAFFWATYAQAELDLLVLHKGKKYGFEFKYADAPFVTKSMRIACHDLKLKHLFVIYPGEKSYLLDKNITALPLHHFQNL